MKDPRTTARELGEGEKAMSGFVVKYKIAGFGDERTTEVYATQSLAQQNADDIKGYEGVQYASVCPTTEPGRSPLPSQPDL